MEIEGDFGEAAEGANKGIVKESPNKWGSDAVAQPPAPNGCFDCNICLDFAVEPVVTLCGHLYCWPCIYKWLQLESPAPQPCPVCKATLSQATLVPLYGRGHTNKGASQHSRLQIPRRPVPSLPRDHSATGSVTESESAQQQQQQQQQLHRQPRLLHGNNGGLRSSMSRSMFQPTTLGGNAIAVLPWVFGDHGAGLYYSNPYYLMGSGSCPRLRRQEMQARRSLHRISIFLFCCMVLCLLLF